MGTMGIGVYKLSSMGLLPNTRSDWVAWESDSQVSQCRFSWYRPFD